MRAIVFSLVIALSSFACVGDGSYIWVDDLGASALRPPLYKVQLGDRLIVNVWNQPPLSGEVLVRPDGNITLPLVGDIFVLNLTPPRIGEEIAKRLGGLVVDPHVSVSLTGTRRLTVSVVGEVRTPGAYEIGGGEGVLEVVARAGGIGEFANKSRVFVIRKSDNSRVRFDFDKLSRAIGAGVQYMLQDGDVVVVE